MTTLPQSCKQDPQSPAYVQRDSGEWSSVGIVYSNIDGSDTPICTAALVGRDIILTARHCVFGNDGILESRQYFRFNLDGDAIEIVQCDTSDLVDSGYLGIGDDIAVCHMEHAVTRIPIRVDVNAAHVIQKKHNVACCWLRSIDWPK